MKLSTNEMLILNILKRQKKAMERRILIEKTGISDKNISAKLNSLETKGLITSERTRKGRTVNRWVQITKEGKDAKTLKIEVTPKPKKIVEKEIPKKIEPKEIIIPKKPPKLPEMRTIQLKPLPATTELKKELRLLINLVFTHRKEKYAKFGYKDVSEVRAQIDTLIDQLGG